MEISLRRKKGATAQNKDMIRALEIANRYMESEVKKSQVRLICKD